ncbi:MAG: hypothetical protein AMXMBFR13_22340 [Phycisphaerae bacterium]
MAPYDLLKSYRPTPAQIALFEKDPWLLLNALDAWIVCAREETANAFCPDWKVDPIPTEATDTLVLWCDLHCANVDPLPLKTMTEFLQTIAWPSMRVYDPTAPHGSRLERKTPPSREVLDACLRDCELVINRIANVAQIHWARTPAPPVPDAAIIDSLRVAIRKLGKIEEKDAKPDAVIEEAKVNRSQGRAALRELEKRGEYDGFTRPQREHHAR